MSTKPESKLKQSNVLILLRPTNKESGLKQAIKQHKQMAHCAPGQLRRPNESRKKNNSAKAAPGQQIK